MINEIINEINNLEYIDLDKSFALSKICSKFLNKKETEHLGRKIVINILDNWDKLNMNSLEIWTNLIENAGFYPYIKKNDLILNNLSAEIRTNFHKSEFLGEIWFHEEQLIVKQILDSDTNLIVSAPTSFGKSLLIENIVSTKKYKNIVIIQPTLALLDETRKKLKKYSEFYKIIVRTSQEESFEKGNIFLLTAERVMEFNFKTRIEFFILDEFYKLSSKRDDERSSILNNAIHMLLTKHRSGFYLLGPNINNISEGFSKKYNAKFFKTDFSIVDVNSVDIYKEHVGKFAERGHKQEYKKKVLFELLSNLKNEQTIIYCSSPSRVRKLSKEFSEYLVSISISENNSCKELVEWIKLNVSKSWGIISCLNLGIGVHDGALQKHITSSIIDYFNSGKLKYLFCTSTIIEGVNTSAKNIIFFDKTKGNRANIDFFDYSNIKGRAGRMMMHYIGKIYNFNCPPKSENIVIDIPFFEQNPISDEVLIQLNESDVKNKESQQYKELMKIPERERELIKENGDLVFGQYNILQTLRKNVRKNHNLLLWSTYPTYEQLSYVLTLAWTNLIKSGESIRPMTLSKLTKITFDYGFNQSIQNLIQSNFKYFVDSNIYPNLSENEIYDEALRDAFQILRHWFQYKIPKWLSVVNSIQNYVCNEEGISPGDYSFYASAIENDFIRPNLTILAEYGIPKSAILKIEKYIPSDSNEEYVLNQVKNKNFLDKINFIDYELMKIKSNL